METRCKYVNKPCLNARSLKDDGSLHRLCAFHRAKANDAQRRWHSRRRTGGTSAKRRAPDDDSGGDTDGHAPPPPIDAPHARHAPYPPHHAHVVPPLAPPTAGAMPAPSPSPKRRYMGPQELPALAEVMMMLRQRRPNDGLGGSGPAALPVRPMEPAYPVETPWANGAPHAHAPPPAHARYYEEPPPRMAYRHEAEYADHSRGQAPPGGRYDERYDPRYDERYDERYGERRDDPSDSVVRPLHAPRARIPREDDKNGVSRA